MFSPGIGSKEWIENHKYCNGCGEEIKIVRTGDKFDPKTGKVIRYLVRAVCPNHSPWSISHTAYTWKEKA